MQIIAGQDEAVAGWAGANLGVRFQEPYTAYGFTDANGNIDGAVVFNDYYPGGNVEVTYFGPRSLSRSVILFMARFCFDELKATRVTAKTRRSNCVVRRLLPKGGFAFECTQRRYFGPEKGDDALVFVMTRENAARWLKR
ncbi:hypothetical protein D3C80_253830 [compost metagenome]